jgi:hypothetical protein
MNFARYDHKRLLHCIIHIAGLAVPAGISAGVRLADGQQMSNGSGIARLRGEDQIVPFNSTDGHGLDPLVEFAANHGAHGAKAKQASHGQHDACADAAQDAEIFDVHGNVFCDFM